MRKVALVVAMCVRLFVQPADAQTVKLAWDPNTESNLAGYLLSYGTASRAYTTTIDVGKVTSFVFSKPNPAIPYYLALRAYNTTGAISPYSSEVVSPPNAPLTVTGLTSNRLSPQPAGTSIVFTAIASGGVKPYQFKWWIGNGTTSAVAKQWSTSNTFTWTPTSPGSSYAIRVWARNATSTVDAPASSAAILSMTFNITAATTVNQPPVVNAGADKTIWLPSSVTVIGIGSDDGKPVPPARLTLAWTKVSGPGTVVFGTPTAASTTATFSAPGTYIFRLTGWDGALSRSDDVTVIVNQDHR
jgi:hypothetical protein